MLNCGNVGSCHADHDVDVPVLSDTTIRSGTGWLYRDAEPVPRLLF